MGWTSWLLRMAKVRWEELIPIKCTHARLCTKSGWIFILCLHKKFSCPCPIRRQIDPRYQMSISWADLSYRSIADDVSAQVLSYWKSAFPYHAYLINGQAMMEKKCPQDNAESTATFSRQSSKRCFLATCWHFQGPRGYRVSNTKLIFFKNQKYFLPGR